MPSFVDPRFLAEGGDRSFTREIERLLWHLGFEGVMNIDGTGDQGGDLLAERAGQRWVLQAKWKRAGGNVNASAIDQVLAAREFYGADRAVVVTNGRFGPIAQRRINDLATVGIDVRLWDGGMLLGLYQEAPGRFGDVQLHPYQERALTKILDDLKGERRALLILATGLGKTYVAGQAINWYLEKHPDAKILVVAHTKELVEQLERALWIHLPKDVRTQLLTGDERRDDLAGITCATVQSALGYARAGYRPLFVMVDEAHHVSDDGQYSELLELTREAWQLGTTATPWRGDAFDITRAFGPPSEKISIEEGMRLGYLADVHYRLFADNINWDFIQSASKHSYSIKDLNARLFLPGRDEAMLDALLKVWSVTSRPRGIVFCRSIEQAERMAAMLRGIPQWGTAAAIHDRMTRRERQLCLMDFRSGKFPLLTAVDILNEGVDVPDVNILCFARVTHSRRIFVQQLGRGLRLREGKTHVEVLDFVSDIKRIAAVMNIREAVSKDEIETLRTGNRIEFADQKVETLMREWIKDAASLETEAAEFRLQFPDVGL